MGQPDLKMEKVRVTPTKQTHFLLLVLLLIMMMMGEGVVGDADSILN